MAPAVFVLAVELTRMPFDGPTVDAPHLSTYGLFALVVGRGFHALLAVLPMALGAAWGVGRYRPVAKTERHGPLPPRPALDGGDGIRRALHRDHRSRSPDRRSTAPIIGADGEPGARGASPS